MGPESCLKSVCTTLPGGGGACDMGAVEVEGYVKAMKVPKNGPKLPEPVDTKNGVEAAEQNGETVVVECQAFNMQWNVIGRVLNRRPDHRWPPSYGGRGLPPE